MDLYMDGPHVYSKLWRPLFSKHKTRNPPASVFDFSLSGERSLKIDYCRVVALIEDRNKFGHNRCKTKCHTKRMETTSRSSTANEVDFCTNGKLNAHLPFQTLNTFPREELFGKVVMVRFDSKLCPGDEQSGSDYPNKNAINTLEYLCNADAKVVIVTHWVMSRNSAKFTAQIIADHLSVCLGKTIIAVEGVIGDEVQCSIDKLQNGEILLLGNLSQYKEEAANCMDFARNLSARIDILVNDAFSDSHRVLASTVGIARFTYARIAGFHLAYMISLLTETLEKPKRPLIAIVASLLTLDQNP